MRHPSFAIVRAGIPAKRLNVGRRDQTRRDAPIKIIGVNSMRAAKIIPEGRSCLTPLRPFLFSLLRRGHTCRIGFMKVMDFKVLLEPDVDYGGYVVTCPSIPGCHSQGKTVEEALANIREAIELCLEVMRERGEELPNPKGTLIGSVVVTQ